MGSPILLLNGWLTGSPVPNRCSTGISPDFLDASDGQLYTCINNEYVQVGNSGTGSQEFNTRFSYRADTTSTGISDPGKGKVRWNNAVQASATQLIVDRLTTDGFDVTLQFLLMGPASRFAIQDPDLALNFQVWEVSSPGVVLADFFTIPVTFIVGNGNPVFANNQSLLVLR